MFDFGSIRKTKLYWTANLTCIKLIYHWLIKLFRLGQRILALEFQIDNSDPLITIILKAIPKNILRQGYELPIHFSLSIFCDDSWTSLKGPYYTRLSQHDNHALVFQALKMKYRQFENCKLLETLLYIILQVNRLGYLFICS